MEYKICFKNFTVHTLKYDHNFLKIFLFQNGVATAQQRKLLLTDSVPRPERFPLQLLTWNKKQTFFSSI